MLSLSFCRGDGACYVTYWVAEHYQGFSSLASPWGLIYIWSLESTFCETETASYLAFTNSHGGVTFILHWWSLFHIG